LFSSVDSPYWTGVVVRRDGGMRSMMEEYDGR